MSVHGEARRESAARLLTIDFDAALAKLAQSQLQGSWQLPAELARLAIASGARSVRLEVEPRHLALVAGGARLDPRTISDFASLLDPGLPAAERHRAMVDLEERDAFVLSAVGCARPESLELATGGGRGLELRLADGQLRVVNASAAALGQPGFELRLRGLEIDAGKASAWLRRAGRFADVPIAINGVGVRRGFHAPLIETRHEVASPGSQSAARPPLPVALAIPRRGGTPRLWLLRHGIIATHATVPGYPAFEAAVEMAPAAPGPAAAATGATLREQLQPYVEPLVDAAVGLTLGLAREAASLPEDDRARTARLLLEAAIKRRRLAEVSGAAVFPLLGPRGRRLVSIDVVSRLMRVEEGGVCALDAIPPGEEPARFALSGHGALALSEGERALLGELLKVVFSNPPARARRPGRRWLDRVSGRLPALPWTRGAAVPETALTPDERTLLARLRAAAADGGLPAAAFRSGGGRARRARDGTLLLPRDSPLVRDCVRAVGRDGAWLYPAAVALLADADSPGPEVRRLWYAGLDSAPG